MKVANFGVVYFFYYVYVDHTPVVHESLHCIVVDTFVHMLFNSFNCIFLSHCLGWGLTLFTFLYNMMFNSTTWYWILNPQLGWMTSANTAARNADQTIFLMQFVICLVEMKWHMYKLH